MHAQSIQFSSKSTRLNSYFDWFVLLTFMPAKVEIKSWRMCLICACMDVTTQFELCLHEQSDTVANDACRVAGQQFLS